MPWMPVAITVACAAAVRIRLLGVPLERDEGEYAYAGQLMLHGIPPYKLAYSMKFPGIDAAYAAIMAVFGQTITGIHLGFLLVNAAAIVLIYLLGKRLISPAAGAAACAAYALLSLGEKVLGTQAHATHFVVLAALGGTLLLLRGIETRRWSTLLWSGVLYGIAVLMKQHGALFVVFGAAYLAWDSLTRRRDAWRAKARDLAIFLGGVAAPILLTGFALWWAGVFEKFWFWTFTYAREYEQELELSLGVETFQNNFKDIVGPNLAIWIIALAGLALIWWKKANRMAALFLSGFLVFSFLAVCPGFYFRNHYFVLMLPAVALLAGAAVGAVGKQWPRFSWIGYCVFGAALVFSVVQQQKYLFRMSPFEISRAMYLESPFPEAVKIADYIRAHTGENARIAVLGSEPEIPFYANRRSATGYIYMYGLMEPQPYAVTMQNELIGDLESLDPDYIVFVTYPTSWIQVPKISTFTILHWWSYYQPKRYKQIVGVADILSADRTEYHWSDAAAYRVQSSSAVMIYKRTDAADDPTAGVSEADAKKAQDKLDETAQENLQRMAIALDPDNFYAYNNLGILLYTRGLPEEAIQEFRISLTINPNQSIVHYDIGKILSEKRLFREAVDEFTQALLFAPGDVHTHNDLGVALFQLGDYEDAAEQFWDAERIDPAYVEAKRNLSLAQARMKNKKAE
jgi:tetratricopeptide (TPR) repeat protein